MILDFHSHVLPGIDHGSDSLKTSIKQLELARKYGITDIVATSHFYPHSNTVNVFLDRRDAAYELLLESARGFGVNLLLGAEILMCSAIESYPQIDRLCIRGTKILLLELPYADFQSGYCRSVFKLISSGYEVVMAHADRYDPSWIEETLEAGAKLQLNATALSLFSRKRYLSWLEKGKVVAIGSDIHRLNKMAFRAFSRASKFVSKYPAITEFSSRILQK